jgi:hypothetical protein
MMIIPSVKAAKEEEGTVLEAGGEEEEATSLMIAY